MRDNLTENCEIEAKSSWLSSYTKKLSVINLVLMIPLTLFVFQVLFKQDLTALLNAFVCILPFLLSLFFVIMFFAARKITAQ